MRRYVHSPVGCCTVGVLAHPPTVQHQRRATWMTHRMRLHACQDASSTTPKAHSPPLRFSKPRHSSRRTLSPCMATASCLLSIRRSRREDDPSVGVHISGQRDYSALAQRKVRRSFHFWHAAPFNAPSLPLAVKTPYLNAWLPQGGNPSRSGQIWPSLWTGEQTNVSGSLYLDCRFNFSFDYFLF